MIISNFAVLAAALHRVWNRYYPASEPNDTMVMLDFGTALPERSGSDSEVQWGEGTAIAGKSMSGAKSDDVRVEKE